MPLSKKFDELFARFGGRIPVAYLRALAQRESSTNPEEASGPAWGLLQVVEVVRRDFNRRNGTRFRRQHLLDPETNVRIATDLLNRIIESYEHNHPNVPNLQADWHNSRFVELLTFGWNAGYSERGGVGKVARYMEAKGDAAGVTIDTVFDSAKPAKASRHLSNPRKVRWCKSVARLFREQDDRNTPGLGVDPRRPVVADVRWTDGKPEVVVNVPLVLGHAAAGLDEHAKNLAAGWRHVASEHGGSCCCKPCHAMRAILGTLPA